MMETKCECGEPMSRDTSFVIHLCSGEVKTVCAVCFLKWNFDGEMTDDGKRRSE